MLSDQWEDLQMSICQFLISPNQYSYPIPGQNEVEVILQTFFYLPSSARMCPTGPKMPFPQPDIPAIFGTSLTKHSGFHAMRSQHFLWKRWPLELEAENVIGETVVLCRELLTLDQPLDRPHRSACERREAQSISARLGFALASCLGIRYSRVFGNDDYEEAFSSGDSQVEFVTESSMDRRNAGNDPINRAQDPGIFRRQYITFVPLSTYCETMHRFHYFGHVDGPEARSSYYSWFKLSQSAVAFYDNLNGGDNADFGRIHKQIGILGGLLDGIPDNDITMTNEAVKIGRTIQYLLHLL
ncbi:hypothetical protein EDB89DRAFT_1906906 [Lactarius sanguifluus]|nr:hypothetical protein EDB89DRAFT_1906906 [Lactarius sanguifluus]